MNSNVTCANAEELKKTLPFSRIKTFEHRHENKNCSACPKDYSRDSLESRDLCESFVSLNHVTWIGSQLLSDF